MDSSLKRVSRPYTASNPAGFGVVEERMRVSGLRGFGMDSHWHEKTVLRRSRNTVAKPETSEVEQDSTGVADGDAVVGKCFRVFDGFPAPYSVGAYRHRLVLHRAH